jgi:hypothetical protein
MQRLRLKEKKKNKRNHSNSFKQLRPIFFRYMSESEDSTSTNNNIKRSSIITPFSPEVEIVGGEGGDGSIITPIGDTQPAQHIIELGNPSSPVEHSFKPAPPETSEKVYTFKRDARSKEQIQKEQELQRESLIEEIVSSLRHNRPGSEVIKNLDVNLSGPALAELVREAKSRLEQERAQQLSAQEDRQAEFQRRLQASRFICPWCSAVCGWTDESESNHLKKCTRYLEHKRAEEDKFQRKRNFEQRYERLLDFEISNAVSGVLDCVEKIDSLKFTESEAKYSAKDPAIIEASQSIQEKIRSESDYDRRRRQNRIANLRNAATAIEALYRRLEEEPKEE